MLKFILEGGKPVWVNIDHIVSVDLSPNGTAIISTTSGTLYTGNPAETVAEWINEAKGLTGSIVVS